MARSYQVTVGSTKVKLVDATLGGGDTVTIENATGAATDLYIGGDENEIPRSVGQSGTLTVSSTTGYIVKAGATYGPVRLGGQEAIYGITNTNTVTVYVFRAGGVR